MAETKPGIWVRSYLVCFSFEGRAPEEHPWAPRPAGDPSQAHSDKDGDDSVVGHSVDEGDPHPELEEPLLSPPSSVSHHTCPLKM